MAISLNIHGASQVRAKSTSYPGARSGRAFVSLSLNIEVEGEAPSEVCLFLPASAGAMAEEIEKALNEIAARYEPVRAKVA